MEFRDKFRVLALLANSVSARCLCKLTVKNAIRQDELQHLPSEALRDESRLIELYADDATLSLTIFLMIGRAPPPTPDLRKLINQQEVYTSP